MLPWLLALAGVAALPLALFWRWGNRRREELEERVAALEERLEAANADARRGAETAALLRQLLVEKGVADAEDFADGGLGPVPEPPRGDLH